MGKLREYLRSTSPELIESLERSWEIAFDTWLPSVNTNKDTFNSYPHLRNLEVYADKAAVAFEKYHIKKRDFLSPVETYVLLASILFHDIGKAAGSNDHGIKSQEIVITSWGLLGIPNEEMANSIGRLCKFHDEKGNDKISKELSSLSRSVVDPYGTIREREIGALLMLVDHIDGSFIRVVPDFIRDCTEKGIIGAFRKKIRGIDIDLEGACVKVVLGEDGWEDGWEDNTYFTNQFDVELNIDQLNWTSFKKYSVFLNTNDFQRTVATLTTSSSIFLNTFRRTAPDLFKFIQMKTSGFQIGQTTLYTLLDEMLRLKLLRIDRKKAWKKAFDFSVYPCPNNKDAFMHIKEARLKFLNNCTTAYAEQCCSIPPRKLLSTILGNTGENIEETKPLHQTLASFGFPIRGWLLEFKDHLFNCNGAESFEPIFTNDYLTHAAKCMWSLSIRIFAHGTLKYETLAAEMREPSLTKVRRAVRRLAIVASVIVVYKENMNEQNPPLSCTIPNAIWYSETHWRWNMVTQNHNNICQGNFVHISDLLDTIKTLKSGDTNE